VNIFVKLSATANPDLILYNPTSF